MPAAHPKRRRRIGPTRLRTLGFAGGDIFSETLLPHIARPSDLDRVSARGYAFGYFGVFITFGTTSLL